MRGTTIPGEGSLRRPRTNDIVAERFDTKKTMTRDEAIALFDAAQAKQAQCDYTGCIADSKTFLTYCRQVENKQWEGAA